MNRDCTCASIARRAWRYSLAVLVLALAGCASVPTPHPQVKLPAHWHHATAQAPAPDYRHWWHALHDPTLDHLVTRALQANPDLQSAIERLRAARVLYLHRDDPFKPSLRINTDEPIDPDASASYFVIGFDARWELPLFGRAKANRQLLRGRLGEATDTLRETRVSLVAETVRDYIDLRAAQQRSGLLRQIQRAQQRQLALAHTRVDLGLASPTTLASAQSDLADTRVQRLKADHDATAAAQQLALLLGRDEPDPAWLQPAPLPVMSGPGPVSVPADLLQTRPGIALARARVMQAAGEQGLARAEMYPSLALGGSLMASTDLASHKQDSADAIGSFGPIIDIPLFDWGMRKARATAKGHLLKAALLAYRKAVLQGVSDVETALDDLHSTQQQAQARHDAWLALDQASSRAGTRYRLGLDSTAQRLVARSERDRARLQLVQARAAHAVAYVALYKALGGASDAGIEAAH